MLDFDPLTHIYTLDGVRIPSVTQVLKEAGLIDFSDVPKDRLDKACQRGKDAHSIIEEYSQGLLSPEASWMYPEIHAWEAFCRDYGFKSEMQEYLCADPILKVGFTIDQIGTIKDQRTIVDLKTGEKKIADVIQVCGYGLLYPVKRLLILYISGSRYKVVEIKGVDRIKGENYFRSALTLYHLRQKEGLLCKEQ